MVDRRTERLDHVGSYAQAARPETSGDMPPCSRRAWTSCACPHAPKTDDCLSSDFIPSHRLTPFPPDHFYPNLTAVTVPLYPGTRIAEEAAQL